jgi:hypothetical protein
VPSSAAGRSLLVLSGVATLVALVALGRLAVFMADDARPNDSAFPSSAWEVRHSCVSAYFVAAGAAREGRSVYRDELYTAPNDDGKSVRKPLKLAASTSTSKVPASVPAAWVRCARSCPASPFRLLWFVLSGVVVAFAMVRVARPTTGPPDARCCWHHWSGSPPR